MYKILLKEPREFTSQLKASLAAEHLRTPALHCSANSQEAFCTKDITIHLRQQLGILRRLTLFASAVFEDDVDDDNVGGEDDKEVVIIMVVLSGSFHKRWHSASSTQAQLCCKQLHGR